MQQNYDDGKYTVIFDEKTGKMEALRHGEHWQDLTGNNLIYFMLVAHADAQVEIARLRGALEEINRTTFDDDANRIAHSALQK